MMLACVMDGHSNMQGQSGFFFSRLLLTRKSKSE
jgi:hypothetical protein